MDTQKWIEHFAANAARTSPPAPDFLAPCEIPQGRARDLLASSLATFQLGETGEGRKLKAYAARVAAARLPGYDRAVEMFVAEENRHARHLADCVRYLGGRLKGAQWTDFVFRRLRRLINLQFELQVLLTAEIVGMSYYALLADAVPDTAVRGLCRRLVADEVGHLRFHADFFRDELRTMNPLLAGLWRWQFRTIFAVTRAVAWWDHRGALAAFGVGRRQIHSRCRRGRRWFESKLAPAGEGAGGIALGEMNL